MPGSLAPVARQRVVTDLGVVAPGALLHTYQNRTTTDQATYTDRDLTVPHANPIVASAGGLFPAIYLSPLQIYTFVLTTAAGVAIWDQDDVSSLDETDPSLTTGTAGEALAAGKPVYLADGSGGTTAGRWYGTDSTTPAKSTLPQSVGFVPAPIASGAIGTIQQAGKITTLSGLTPGATYYLGVTGALTATAPDNARIVGVAESATTLVLTLGLPNVSAFASATAFPPAEPFHFSGFLAHMGT